MLQTRQTKKWFWMMNYCKKKQWAPANNVFWTKAAEAYHLYLSKVKQSIKEDTQFTKALEGTLTEWSSEPDSTVYNLLN